MTLFILIVALMPIFTLALTLPASFEVSDNKTELTIVYHRVSSNITVEAMSSGKLVGHACSSSLSSGNFAQLPIIFDVNERGSGNLTIGPSIYRIHEDIKHSGGIICGRTFNNVEAAVSCIVPVPAELPLQPLNGLEFTKCISDDFHGLAKALRAATRTLSGPTDANQAKIVPIEPPPPKCSKSWTTEVLGDGDPHQNYYNIQLSSYTNCATTPKCSIGYHQPEGFSISYMVSANRHLNKWISAGFSVQEKWTTGTDYNCDAKAGETVCIWYNVAHTAYTVFNNVIDGCNGQSRNGDPFVLYSPNQNNVGGGEYCVIGPCRREGDWYWDYDGPAGGPVA